MKRLLILAAIIAGLPAIIFPQTIEVSDTIKTNTTWTADTVKVMTNLLIPDSITLKISPGTRVEFQGHYKMEVQGTVVAIGTPEDSIVFTIYDTTGFSNHDTIGGGWFGIKFNNELYGTMGDNDTSYFSHCVFSYGKAMHNDNTFKCGGIFLVRSFSRLVISESLIKNTFAALHGGGIYYHTSDVSFRNNIIHNTESTSAIFLAWKCNGLIEGNIITNNQDKGINVSNSNPYITNNLICNNSTRSPTHQIGIGIYVVSGNPIIVNNTICNNFGGGVYFVNSTSKLYNNIIWGNFAPYAGSQVRLGTKNISPDFFNCIIQGGVAEFGGEDFAGQYINCIEEDPLFESPSDSNGVEYDGLNADWRLSAASPAINIGSTAQIGHIIPATDLFRKNRINYGALDIGAIEYQRDFLTVNEDINSDTTLVADTIKVINSFQITDGNTLNIPKGTVVHFKGGTKIDMKGTIIAIGTKDSKIKFTSSDTGYFEIIDSLGYGWDGIDFNYTPASNDTSRFTHCIFEYGKPLSDKWNYQFGGAIYVKNFSKIVIDECIFRNNMADRGGAIFTDYADIIVRNSTFVGNKATMTNARDGGAIYMIQSNCLIENNLIVNNRAFHGGGIYIDGVVGIPTIINNVICNNYAHVGGGIYTVANARIINNTICNNEQYGISIDRCNPEIKNSILWGNKYSHSNYYQIFGGDDNNPIIIYNNIQGGLESIREGIGGGIYENNIDTLPRFLDPSEGAGINFDGLQANWSVDDFSPCIDQGTSDIIGLPNIDFEGNPRINNEKIDIGAIENQSAIPGILGQPANLIKCEGENAVFEVIVNDTARIQWFRDGDTLHGATRVVLTIDSLTGNDVGNYTCRLSNAYGEVVAIPAYLFITEKPVFLQEPKNLWVERDEPAIIKVFARGTNITYQWQKDGMNIKDEATPELYIAKSDHTSEGTYRCIISNKCAKDTSRDATLFVAPQICMVTVSTVTGNNLVVWEKSTSASLTDYNIYRESTAAGIYDLMATVPAGDLSVWEDITADPTKRAYIYKITGTDTSGYETPPDLCKPHKTIHLLVSTNPELNSTQLLWDRYFGFDYQTYSIYRSTTQSNFTIVDYMPSSLNSWTETDAGDTEVFYRVSVQKPDPCIPTGGGKKADSGPYSHALSNMDDNRLQAGQSPPDTILLSNHTIDENNTIGALIGRLTTIDRDTLDNHTYQLVPGEGDDGNGAFTLISDLLVAADYFDYESQDSYHIRVRCLDRYDNFVENTFAITINDVAEPTGYQRYSTQPIMVYPNPFNSSTTIVFPNQDEKEYRLMIMDLSGKVVRSVDHITTSTFILQRENLEKGLYLIELRGERIYRGRIVIE